MDKAQRRDLATLHIEARVLTDMLAQRIRWLRSQTDIDPAKHQAAIDAAIGELMGAAAIMAAVDLRALHDGAKPRPPRRTASTWPNGELSSWWSAFLDRWCDLRSGLEEQARLLHEALQVMPNPLLHGVTGDLARERLGFLQGLAARMGGTKMDAIDALVREHNIAAELDDPLWGWSRVTP